MASNNPQTPPHVTEHKTLSDQVNQPNPNALIAQQEKHLLDRYWNYQREQMARTDRDFKKHELPLSRIKKIMKSDHDVQMVATEAPILLAKASEFFIQELTMRAWLHTEHAKRRILRKDDIAKVINETDTYDFLYDEQAGGGSSSVVSSHGDPGSSAREVTTDGVLTALQRWIRYGDENEMNEGEEKNDANDDGGAPQ